MHLAKFYEDTIIENLFLQFSLDFTHENIYENIGSHGIIIAITFPCDLSVHRTRVP